MELISISLFIDNLVNILTIRGSVLHSNQAHFKLKTHQCMLLKALNEHCFIWPDIMFPTVFCVVLDVFFYETSGKNENFS